MPSIFTSRFGKLNVSIVAIFSMLIILPNCTEDEDISPNDTVFITPDCYGESGFPETASAYAQMIEPHLGIVPTVILDSLIEIPLFQDGTQVYGEFDNSEIDNPSRLGGKGTWSGSALQRYEGRRADGTPLPDVVWLAFLRNATSSPFSIAGSVQLIGYNQATGATAFFESPDVLGSNDLANRVTTVDPTTLRLSGAMPGPDDPSAFNQAYIAPPVTLKSGIQCVACHQADPFITNSFINAAKIPGTNESVVPQLSANAPYYVVGGEDWDMRTINIEGNQCLSCHRVGMTTIALFKEGGYDVNAHMPPDKPGSLAKDWEELLEGWSEGPENVEGAEWVIPPACADNNGQNQVVGEEYPFKKCFNEPGEGPFCD